MTSRQMQQFNQMRAALCRIAREYVSPQKLYRDAERLYGITGIEAIEMAYENIQNEARAAVKGVKEITDAAPTTARE